MILINDGATDSNDATVEVPMVKYTPNAQSEVPTVEKKAPPPPPTPGANFSCCS